MTWSLFNNNASDIIDSIGTAADKIFTSDEERLEFKKQFTEQKIRFSEMQHELNMIEAKSSRLFNSGWRPSIGWICGISLALYFIPKFAIGAYIFISHYITTGLIIDYPVDATQIFALITALLGMGTLRTFEKHKGLTK